ncbi:hypothetical protein LDL36_20600 [Komagataeibacter sp. FNDCR1]|nr:hypothetical protein [Komagataeibacter sp. FNDCR1]
MDDILNQIDAFLTEQGMAPSTFGKMAVNDEHYVAHLRNGRENFSRTRTKVLAFMESFRQSKLNEKSEAERMLEGRVPARSLRFTLPRPYMLLNPYLRLHWSARRKYMRSLVWDIKMATVTPPEHAQPFDYARVTIHRYSPGTADKDGVEGGAKPLIDCLTTPAPMRMKKGATAVKMRNPYGLGFIRDDSPRHCFQIALGFRSSQQTARTEILIEEMVYPDRDEPP